VKKKIEIETMSDCLGSFEWRTLQITTCDRIIRSSSSSSSSSSPSMNGDQNQRNDESGLSGRKRKDDAIERTTSFDLQELFATLVEVQTLPSLMLPRYSLLISDNTSLRYCRVEFW
jgi:hypothetical protein